MFRSALLLAIAATAVLRAGQAPDQQDPQGFVFKSGVELVNVTATVTDADGHFVEGLTRDDFRVYEDDVLREIAYFGADRVPVSLGIVLDTSGSMAGDRIRAARGALDQFLSVLDDPGDEFFLYRFDERPLLLQGWTNDRRAISRALADIDPDGGTALYDAIARALPLAAAGHNPKKAVIVISDGNEAESRTAVVDVQRLARETEVLVYGIAIDAQAADSKSAPGLPRWPAPPVPTPTPRFPIPNPRPLPRPPGGLLRSAQWQWPPGWPGSSSSSNADDHANPETLRRITDDSGGRTAMIRDASELRPAIQAIADELSRQYVLGYQADGDKDGRWHAIRVEVQPGRYQVRARRGYFAS